MEWAEAGLPQAAAKSVPAYVTAGEHMPSDGLG
jgi:hypothetical protein